MSEFDTRDVYDRCVAALTEHDRARVNGFASQDIISHGRPATRAHAIASA